MTSMTTSDFESTSLNTSFDPETCVIRANWLHVGLGEVDTGDLPRNKIIFSSGGESLTEFENLGNFSITDEELLYKSRAKFEFGITVHTVVGIRNVLPDLDLNKYVKNLFFYVLRAKMYGNTEEYYYVEWNQLDYGDRINLFDYATFLPVTVGIKKLTGLNGSVTLNNHTYKTPTITGDILKVIVTNVTSGSIGNYTDTFEDISGIEEASVELVPLDDFSSDDQRIIDYYNNADLGWQAGPIEEGGTITQSMASGGQPGVTFNNPNPRDDKMFTFNLHSVLAPGTYEYVQYNHIRQAGIVFWEWGFWAGHVDAVYGPVSKIVPRRVVGVHTNNYFVRWDFSVDVEFLATIPSTAEFSRLVLNDPYLVMGDWVWDSSIVGSYEVDIPLNPYYPDEFWEDLMGAIFGALGPILSIFLVIIVIILGILMLFVWVPRLIAKSMRKKRKKKIERR